MSYPAFFENVIGVDIHPSCKTKDSYIYTSNNNINILGMGGNHRLAWLDNKYTIRQGASFTTAYISALIIKWLQNGMQVNDCDENLKKYAKKIIEKKEVLNNTNNGFTKQRIALFPYNK
ncbi:hypothetical protein GNF51_15525, partial [Clostridium perfringens]|uniref:hypothetical protein n=1 Tax=Clostridium perfringens TaxID=1502 RepID=UPI002AC72C16